MSSVLPFAMHDEATRFGPFLLDPSRRMLLLDDQPVGLGSRSFALLAVLIQRAGEIVSKNELMRAVWPESVVEESNLRVHMAALRKALGVPADGGHYIVNIPLRGYSFVASVVRLRSGDAVSKPDDRTPQRRVAQLPAALTRLFGRQEVVDELVRRLPAQRLITLVGPGGAGKTSVSLATGRSLAAHSDDGAWFVDLSALEDPLLVPSAFATALGVPDVAARPLPAIVAFLAGKRVLLVVDNCERVVSAAAEICEALRAALPTVLILATSREPLLAAGEHVHRLAPLTLPPAHGILTRAQYLACPSVQLFIERATATVDAFDVDDASLPVIAGICRRLDGMPLAIELAAARVEAFGIRGLSATLDEHLLILSGGRRTAPARHQTIRATLNWSYQTLSEQEQRVLRRLSVFQAMFPLEAAQEMFDEEERGDVIRHVSELVLKSLLSVDFTGDVVQYRMLDATRAFAFEQLALADERESCVRRHAEHCARLAHDVQAEWPGTMGLASAASWMERYARRLDDLRVAFDGSLTRGEVSLACQLLGDSAQLWFQLALTAEFLARAERALALLGSASQVKPMVELTLSAGLSQALVHNEGSGSQRLIEVSGRVLEMARAAGHVVFERQMLFRLWNAAVANGKYVESLELARQFEQISTASADPNDGILIDRMMMLTLHTLGEHAKARDHSSRILDHPSVKGRSLRNGRFQIDHQVIALCFRAKILWVLGLPDQAWQTAGDAVEESQLTGHVLAGMYARGISASLVAMWIGDLDAADAHVAVMARDSVDQSLAYWDAWSRCFDQALTYRGYPVPTNRPRMPVVGNRPFSGMQEEVLATVAEGLLTDDVIVRAEMLGPRSWSSPEVFRCQALRVQAAGGDLAFTQAEELLRRSARMASEQGAKSWQLRTAMSQARFYRMRDQRRQAIDLLEPIFHSFTEGHATADLVEAGELLRELQSSN